MQIGRYIRRYYYSKINPPNNIPSDCFKDLKLVSKHSIILKNLKNLIIYLFLLEIQWKNYQRIRDEIKKTNVFGKTALKPYNLKLFIQELCSFDVLICDNENKEFKKRYFTLNKLIVPKLYCRELTSIKNNLKNYFQKKLKKIN